MAYNNPWLVQSVLQDIHALDLPHPASALLTEFVLEALDPAVAALYAHKQLANNQASSFLSDWIHVIESIGSNSKRPATPDNDTIQAIIKRDGNKCCVSGKAGSLLDPLVVVPILPIPSGWLDNKPRYHYLLYAFFGRPYAEWWYCTIEKSDSISPFHNHWLVKKSVSDALRNGTIRLVRQMPSMMEYKVDQVIIDDTRPITVQGNHALLGDWSRTGIEKVDARFVGSHARFCKCFQLVALAKTSAPELVCNSTKPIEKLARPQLSPLWQRRSPTSILSKLFTTPLQIIWSTVPTSLRIATYEILRKIGRRWYGIDDPNTKVQRIPFGLYLKYDGDSAAYRNEYNALKMVEKHTSISAPRALDIATKFIQDADEEDPFDFGPVMANYLLITRVPGTTLASTYNAISDENMQDICLQLQQYISQIRDIPRTNKSDTGICNTLGEAIRDPRVCGGDAVGPFPDETGFNQNLRFPDDAARSGHKVVFTHADLNPRNIMVQRVRSKDGDDRWQVSGIVDWEAAGYYPDYWDCTKSLFERFRWPKRYNDMIKRVFGVFGDYSREMDVEIRSWEAGDGI